MHIRKTNLFLSLVFAGCLFSSLSYAYREDGGGGSYTAPTPAQTVSQAQPSDPLGMGRYTGSYNIDALARNGQGSGSSQDQSSSRNVNVVNTPNVIDTNAENYLNGIENILGTTPSNPALPFGNASSQPYSIQAILGDPMWDTISSVGSTTPSNVASFPTVKEIPQFPVLQQNALPCNPNPAAVSTSSKKTPPSDSIVSLLYQILIAVGGSPATEKIYVDANCIATGAIQKDALSTAQQAQWDASLNLIGGYYNAPDKNQTADDSGKHVKHFSWDCVTGFGPSMPASGGPYTDYNALMLKKNGCDPDQYSKRPRMNRSTEALLAPLEYPAPQSMKLPTSQTDQTFYRFTVSPADAGRAPQSVYVWDPTLSYYPIYAAAGYCQNIEQHVIPAYPQRPSGSTDDYRLYNRGALHEAIESNALAQCWRFFEERVQYQQGTGRYQVQVNRCTEDYQQHIIDLDTWKDCISYGRSTLKALADEAYRGDSQAYTEYLATVSPSVRAELLAQAQSDMFRFEQQLLEERQIMSQALATISRAPVSLGESSTAVTVQPIVPHQVQ